MKVMFIVPYTPSLIRTRSYNLIRSLITLGHSVTLVTLTESEGDLNSLAELEAVGVETVYASHAKLTAMRNMAFTMPSLEPLQAAYSWNTELFDKLKASILDAAPDVIHVEHLRGARFGLRLMDAMQKGRLPGVPVVWDSVDCISYLFEQSARESRSFSKKLITAFELPRTRRSETKLVAAFDHVVTTSPIDKKALLELQPNGADIDIIPNGVALDYFGEDLQQATLPKTVVLSGKMSYHANITAALYLINDVMPLVWQKDPAVKVKIVGSSPTPQIKALATDHPEHVEVTGFVEDLRPHLQSATVAAVPILYGAGSQFKVLEAMASRTAVVATKRATSALAVTSGAELLISETAQEFADNLLTVLNNAGVRDEIAAAGNHYVRQSHDWLEIAKKLVSVYVEVNQSYTGRAV